MPFLCVEWVARTVVPKFPHGYLPSAINNFLLDRVRGRLSFRSSRLRCLASDGL